MTGSIDVRYSRYRRAFRWYPKEWRDKNQDAALSTLLDVAEGEGRLRPRPSELASIAGNGLSARLGVLLPESVRDPAASFALATGAAFAVLMFVCDSVLQLSTAGAPGYPRPGYLGAGIRVDLLVYAPWIIAFVVTMVRRPAAARWVLAAGMLVSVGVALIRLLEGPGWAGPSSTSIGFLFLLGSIAVAGRPTTRRPGARRYLAVKGGAVLALLAGLGVSSGAMTDFDSTGIWWYIGDRVFWWRAASDYNLGVALLAVVVVVGALALAGKRAAAGVLAVSAVPWLAALLVSLSTDGRGGWAAALVILGVLLVFGLLLAIFRRTSFELVVRRRGSSGS